MRGDEDFSQATVPETTARPDEPGDDRRRRHAARRFFRAAPPYCIEFDADGTAMLCQKAYEYWPDLAPEEATTWRVISRHQNLGSRASPADHLRRPGLLRCRGPRGEQATAAPKAALGFAPD